MGDAEETPRPAWRSVWPADAATTCLFTVGVLAAGASAGSLLALLLQ